MGVVEGGKTNPRKTHNQTARRSEHPVADKPKTGKIPPMPAKQVSEESQATWTDKDQAEFIKDIERTMKLKFSKQDKEAIGTMMFYEDLRLQLGMKPWDLHPLPLETESQSEFMI